PEDIDDDAWAGTYDATLRLRLAHPSRLMGLDWMMVCGARLPVYTSTIERYLDMPDRRRWCVVGEQVTLRVAETQTMYRDIEHYRNAAGKAGGGAQANDVLEAAADERVARSVGLVKVFGDEPLGQ